MRIACVLGHVICVGSCVGSGGVCLCAVSIDWAHCGRHSVLLLDYFALRPSAAEQGGAREIARSARTRTSRARAGSALRRAGRGRRGNGGRRAGRGAHAIATRRIEARANEEQEAHMRNTKIRYIFAFGNLQLCEFED